MKSYSGTVNFVMGGRLDPDSFDGLVENFNRGLHQFGVQVTRKPDADKRLKKAIEVKATPDGIAPILDEGKTSITMELQKIIDDQANLGNQERRPSFVTVELQDNSL